jgi:hypothetical protein
MEAPQGSKVILKQLLREIWGPSLWIDTHLLEMKIEANYGFKDDPVPSQTKVCLVEPKDLDYPQKFSFKGRSHLGFSPSPSF